MTNGVKAVKMPGMRSVTASPSVPERETTVTTTTKQTIPAQNSQIVDFWPYVEALKPEDWIKHIVYIYRTDPRVSTYGDGSSAIEKITGYLELGPGRQLPFNSREEVELGIREKHGGKAFRLILKRGSERIAESRCSNDLPPRFPHTVPGGAGNGQPPTASGYSSDASATADVAKVAMSTMAGQERATTETAVRALDAASQVVMRMAQGTTPPPPSAMDQAMQSMMVELMRRSLNPPAPPPAPDPIEQMTKLAGLLNQFNGGGGGAGLGPLAPIVTKFLETASDRVFNPAAASPTSSAAAELVRQLPGVAGYVTQAIREWRAGVEAQRDTAAMMTGRSRPPAPAAPPAAAPQPNMQPPPTQLPTPPGGEIVMPSLEFIEVKIIEIIEEGNPAEDTADDILSFIERMDSALPAQLHSLGEAELLKLFQARPILQPALKNMPRLVEVIRAILRLTEPKPPAAGPGTIEGTPQNG